MNSKNPAANATALHDDIMAYIERANALMASGQTTSLAGLDTVVETLCKRIVALDPNAASNFAPQLAQLMQRLNGLQGTMQSALDACKSEVDGLDKHQRASKAYRKKEKK